MSTANRILIISNGPVCRNPRVYKEATTLGDAGYDVTVLTVRDHAPSESRDRELLQGAHFRRVTVDLLPGYGTRQAVVFFRRLQLWAARKLAQRGLIHTVQSLGPARALLAAARRLPADLTIVHNEIAHWTGTRLMRDGRRVAADIEDWHSEDLLPEQRAARPLDVIRGVEHTLLNSAVYCTTTSRALAGALHARYGGRQPEVITNSFPLQPAPDADALASIPAFFWFSQTIGPGRGLEPFLAAWQLTVQPSRLVLLGDVASDFAHVLLGRIPESRRAAVTFLPLVSAAELPAVIARHDIGLAMEQAFIPNRDLTVTNKILQYLNAGLVVVATDTAGQREVLAGSPDAGILVATDHPQALASRLDALLSDRATLVRRRRAARALAETTYCWEQEAPRLRALVNRALSS